MIRKFLIFHSDEDFRLDNFKFKGEGGGRKEIDTRWVNENRDTRFFFL